MKARTFYGKDPAAEVILKEGPSRSGLCKVAVVDVYGIETEFIRSAHQLVPLDDEARAKLEGGRS
jgi:hypothetical protein